MENKAQAALEYLLIIGGAVIIAAIVILVLTSMGATGNITNSNSRFQHVYNKLYHAQQ